MINFETLLDKQLKRKPRCKIGIIGSNGNFGYTFIAQSLLMERTICLRAVCDLDIDKSIVLLKRMGISEARLYPCTCKDEIGKVPTDGIIVLQDSKLVAVTDVDVMVEAAGSPEISALNAELCIIAGKHVIMASKESDVIAGPYLYRLAKSKRVVYSLAIGDQPANLINWISYFQTLGIEIIAAGKSSEYDFVYDLVSGKFQYRDKVRYIPELREYWKMGNLKKTLAGRKRILSEFPQFAVPDYNEMNVVANATGLLPSCPRLHYPIANVTEIAEIYSLSKDGGLVEKPGVLDSFNCLHRFDEVSFAGGVFVVVSSHNRKVFEILKSKGHVFSRGGGYAAFYLPYHYMGLEAPMSVLQAYYMNNPGYARCDNNATMVCRTERVFKKGERLDLHTHHRCLEDMQVTFEPTKSLPRNVAPYYLISEKNVAEDIPEGTIVTLDMIDFSGSNLKRMFDSMR